MTEWQLQAIAPDLNIIKPEHVAEAYARLRRGEGVPLHMLRTSCILGPADSEAPYLEWRKVTKASEA